METFTSSPLPRDIPGSSSRRRTPTVRNFHISTTHGSPRIASIDSNTSITWHIRRTAETYRNDPGKPYFYHSCKQNNKVLNTYGLPAPRILNNGPCISKNNKNSRTSVPKDLQPQATFTCSPKPHRSQSRPFGYSVLDIHWDCQVVVAALIRHRRIHACECGFESLKKQWGCSGDGTGSLVIEAMEKHDRGCTCGAFEF